MRPSTLHRSLAYSASGIAGVYMTLALMASGCLFAHAAPSDGHHQHSGTDSHASLCFWACQSTSDVGPLAQAAGGVVRAAQFHPLPSAPPFIDVQGHAVLHTRAPPVSARGSVRAGRSAFSSQHS
ncbi:MAG: hypothetical protein GDA65_14180 [Nitrospira sp. CR1.1]|nr:hypothetical protein [Nitrospira sp. CR1.1]